MTSIASQEKLELFDKVKNILLYLRSNIHNEGEAETRVTMADYLWRKRPAGPILETITKRASGATVTKRKKSCVESATTSYTSIRKYGMCKNMGHYKDARKLGKQIGVRLKIVMAKNRFGQHGRGCCC